MLRPAARRMFRAIDRSSTLRETSVEIAVAGFESDAADERPWNAAVLNCRYGSLAQPRAGIADDANARAVVRRAGQVHVARRRSDS